LGAASARFGYPIMSSAMAIQRALERLSARHIALFSPYPDWLTQASHDYWSGLGDQIVSRASMPDDTSDTVSIYGLNSSGLLAAAEALQTEQADVILVTSTGMPILPAIEALFQRSGLPVLCSNLCLAWALLDTLGLADLAPPKAPWETLIGGWTARLARL